MRNSERVEELCRKANHYVSEQHSYRNFRDWRPISIKNQGPIIGLETVVNIGERRRVIKPGKTVLDMGSGSGSSAIYWASRGYKVIAIELNKDLVNVQKKIFQETNKLDISLLQGSYYPKEYIDLRQQGKSKAIALENAFLKKFPDAAEVFHPVCNVDTYDKNLQDIKMIDIFYCYVWPIQSPSVIEMYSMFSNMDSVLCLVGHFEPEWLREFQLQLVENSPFILHS